MASAVRALRLSASAVLVSLATMTAAQTPPTTTEVTKGAATVTTSELKGEVEYVEGNSLVVTMSSGEVRTFHIPESRRFLIDGKELSVHELKPGTMLTASVTTTATPVITRTTTVGSGTVWHVLRNNVIVTLPNGENKQFIVEADTRITVNGRPTTVADLRKGMVVHAERVVEQPMTEITTDTRVLGQAPPQPAPKTEPAPAVVQPMPTEPPEAEAQTAPVEPAPPTTSRPVPRVALWVVLLVGAAIAVWMFARRKSG
jgi:hypothetical protein